MKIFHKLSALLAAAAAFMLAGPSSAEPVAAISAGQSGKIEFMSSTPKNRWTLARSVFRLDNQIENPIVVWGDLRLPPNRQAGVKVPAVVISHGSEGVSSLYYDVWAKAFLGAGYAVFIVDSQTPRGRNKPLRELQLTWNTTANVSDGLHALKVLSTDPDIDPSRIFHIGFSRGASASMSSAWPIYQRAILDPNGARYAGHIAVYPGCNLRYHEELTAKNTAPLLLLLGEKDDMTPAQPCAEYAEYLAKAGNDVRYKIYPGAYHVFDRLNQRWAQFKEGTFADCYLDITILVDRKQSMDNVPFGNYRTGQRFTSFDQSEAATKECAKEKWITVESNLTAREAAVADVLAFIKSQPAK